MKYKASLSTVIFIVLIEISGASRATGLSGDPKPLEQKVVMRRQSATKSLNQIARLYDVTLLYHYNTLENFETNAIYGYYDFTTAISALLENTGLSAQVDGKIISITPIPLTNKTSKSQPRAPKPDFNPGIEDSVEIIEVSGYAISLKKSLNRKRFSSAIIDVISNEELGKFPGQNLAEALQQLPGASIDRSKGDGRFITVRGLGPEFNTTTYNGRILATENTGREFSFDIMSPNSVNQAIINKSAVYSNVANSVGANIDLVFNQPLAIAKSKTLLDVSLGLNDLTSKHYRSISGFSSWRAENAGFVVSAFMEDRDFSIDSANIDGWMLTDLSYVPNQLGKGDFSQAFIPRNFDLRREEGTKSRRELIAVYQALISDNSVITIDGLFIDYDVDSRSNSSANWTQNSTPAFSSVQVNENNTLMAYEYDDAAKIAADFVQLSSNRPTQTRQLGVNWGSRIFNDTDISIDVSVSQAKNNNGGNDIFFIVGSPNATPQFHYPTNAAYPTISHRNPVQVSDLRSHAMIYEGESNKDEVQQYQLEIEHANDKLFEHVSAGLVWLTREKSKTDFKTPWGWEFGGYNFDLPDNLFSEQQLADFLEGGVPTTWYTFDHKKYEAFLWFDAHIRSQRAQNNPALLEDIDERKANGGISPVLREGDSWQIKENIKEAYFGGEYTFDLSNASLTGTVGLRYSHTDTHAFGHSQLITDISNHPSDPTSLNLTLSDPVPVEASHSYAYWLPSTNVMLALDAVTVLQASYSKTLSRPNFGRLSVALGNYNARVGESSAYSGNPKLLPYKSDNYDLGLSWYFDKLRFAEINFFIKRLDNFIAERTALQPLFDHPEGNFLVTAPRNAEPLSIRGIEGAFQTQITNPSNIFHNLGLQLNFTFVNSNEVFDPINRPDAFALEGLSNAYNIVLFYDSEFAQIKLNYNHRGNFLQKAKGRQSQPEMVASYDQLDLSVELRPTQKLSVYFSAFNLLNSKYRAYSIYNERLLRYEETGTMFKLGLRYQY